MRAFVTGGSGFIGGRLIKQLAARGDTVVCLIRDPARVKTNPAQPNVQWVKGDVTDPTSLKAPMQGADVVYHLAGVYEFGPKHFQHMRGINVDGARNVLQLAAELGVPKIVHTSTTAVLGNTHGKIVDETHKVSMQELPSEYERTKWQAHYEVAVPLQQKGAPLIIIQPGGVTGAGDTSPLMQFVDYYLNRFPLGIGATAGVTIAHVDDIAAGHILAVERGRVGESYILAGPCLTYKQMEEMWVKLSGIPIPGFWLPNWMIGLNQSLLGITERMGLEMPFNSESMAIMQDYTFWAKADKAGRELGWKSRPVEDTFRDMLDYEIKRRGIKTTS